MRRNNLHPFQKLISMLLVMAVLLSFVALPAGAEENESFLWEEDFETGLDGWEVKDKAGEWAEYDPDDTAISLTAKAYAGNQSFSLKNKDYQILIRKDFESDMNKVLSVWFYDFVSSTSTETRVFACMDKIVDSTTSRLALGVRKDTSAANYTLWIDKDTYQDTRVPRTTGWHQFTWDARSGSGVDVYIDGIKVVTDTAHTDFNRIILGWWTKAIGTTNAFDHVVISDELPWENEHTCVDADKNHNCDVCGTELSECEDQNNDNTCDYCGGAWLFKDSIGEYEANELSGYEAATYGTDSPIMIDGYSKTAGKRIEKIKLPVISVSKISDKYTFSLYSVRENYLTTKNYKQSFIQRYDIDVTPYLNTLTDTVVNRWITVDVSSYNIEINEGEFLAFGDSTNNVLIAKDQEDIFLDVLATDLKVETVSCPNYAGKYLSTLGDSISTYQGYTANPIANTTLAENEVGYTGHNKDVTNVNQTWWFQLAQQTGMKLLVTNGYNGDQMAVKGVSRSLQLHGNTGEYDGIEPDVVVSYIGINDIKAQATLESFEKNYRQIVTNVTTNYENAELYVLTHVPFTWYNSWDTSVEGGLEKLQQYNDIIREIANESDTDKVYLVDYYALSNRTQANHLAYAVDGLHPNQPGMDVITELIIDSLQNKNTNPGEPDEPNESNKPSNPDTSLKTLADKYYFFDPSIVSKEENAELKIAQVSKSTTDQSWLDQYKWTVDSDIPDWEQRVTIMYPHVEYNSSTGVYQMWYESLYTASPVAGFDWRENLIDATNSKNVDLGTFANTAKGTVYEGKDVLCYMESTDGVHWTRPDCGEFYYKTREDEIIGTNIVFIGSHGLGVNKNENPDRSEPLFLLAGRAYESDYYPGSDPTDKVGVTISWSNDGIHWEAPVTIKTGDEHSANITYVRADSHNQLFWSTERDCYAVITRSYTGSLRQVAYLEAKDNLNSIRDMATVKANGGEKYWEKTSPYWTTPDHALDFHVTTGAQPYSMPILHVANDYYIGVVSMLDWNGANGVQYQVHAELTWSPDGKTWYYMDKGTPVIANATTFALERGNDYGMIYCAAPVEVGNQVKIYYAAVPELHYTAYSQIPSNIKSIVDTEIPNATGKGVTRTTTLSVATFGKDRYAGYHAEDGIVTTNWFKVAGSDLKLTADVASGGSLKVAVIGEDGNVMEGYGFEDCTAVTANITDGNITWGENDLFALNGQTVSFQIQLNNASVYTISGDIEPTEGPELPADPFSWEEDFEEGLSEWTVRDGTKVWTDVEPYEYISLTAKAYESNQGFGLKNSNGQVLVRKNFGKQMNKVLSVMFYDDISSTEKRVMACMEVDANNRLAIGVHADTSATHYVLWPQSYQGESVNYQATNVKRSTGWHQFTWDARSGTGIDLYIDGEKILTDTTRTAFSQITLGWWTAAIGTTNAFDNVVIGDELPWEVEKALEISIDNMTGETAGATITAPADGWAEGTNTFTVSCDNACVVAISNDNGTTYTRLAATATETEGTYSFTAENVGADTKIAIVKIGDADGNGEIAANDAAVAKGMNLESITDATVQQLLAVDLNGDGTITANEVAVVKAATLGNVLSW